MWEKLINLEKTSSCPNWAQRFANNRHEFTITVQEKIFKVRRNANYFKNKKEKDKHKGVK